MNMWIVKVIVGSKTGRIVAGALGAILILFATITLWERGIRNQVLQEVETQQIKQEIETRKRIDEAVRNSPREFDDAVEWLRKRNSGE